MVFTCRLPVEQALVPTALTVPEGKVQYIVVRPGVECLKLAVGPLDDPLGVAPLDLDRAQEEPAQALPHQKICTPERDGDG